MSHSIPGQHAPGTREVVFDTETTGFSYSGADRVVEIGCVEIIDMKKTGRSWQSYLNPRRDMPYGAFKVHGLSREFLADKPLFESVADEFLNWIGDATLVAHNAKFDVAFINAELRRLGREPLKNPVVDTIVLSKKKFPRAMANLDNLCRLLGVDTSARDRHGALLDSELLASVYIKLRGGSANELSLGQKSDSRSDILANSIKSVQFARRNIGLPTQHEIEEHGKLVASLKGPIWGGPG